MEQQNLQDNTDIEIDVLELFHVLLNKFWIILLAGIIAGLAFIGGTILFITPQYESTTKMYVLSKQDNNTLTQQDMQTSLSLTKDYAELIKSRTVTEGVIAQLNLDLTHEELLKKMAVDSATDTRILSITVTDADPYEACKIANAIRDVAANHIKNVMDIDAVNVVETANIPDQKASPSITKNGIIGGFLGVLLSVVIILIAYISNDTVKTQEDVEKYLGLSVLGTIPLTETDRKKKKKKQKQKKARGRR
ncbi:MAG: YveK family protein [Blautia obeum]